MLQIAEHLEIRHLISNGRGADAEIVFLRERPRADRLSRCDIIIDNRPQDLTFSRVQIVRHSPLSSPFKHC